MQSSIPRNDTFLDWSWHERRLDLTLACATFYLAPLALAIWCPPGVWRVAGMLLAIGLGLWLAAPNRRRLDGVILILEIWPDHDWRIFCWVVGFVITCYADGALKNKPPEPPESEWD